MRPPVSRAFGRQTQRGPHLSNHGVWPLVDVGRRKTQQAESGVDQKVLSPVVLDQASPMIVSVVLENEPRRRVVEVGPADETAFGISEISLDIWLRESGFDQQPPKPGLHR